jgi:phosphatidylserine decarboxylase
MFSKIFPKIHNEGYKFIVIAVFVTIVLLFINNFLGLVGILLSIWVYYFFRDPERIIIGDDNYLLSPADGEVIKVEEVEGLQEVGIESKKIKKNKYIHECI